jgi:repressor LexA
MEKLESQIAEFVGNYTPRHGYPPTVEELINTFGIFHIMCVMFYVLSLYRIGMIRNSLFFGTGNLQLITMRLSN